MPDPATAPKARLSIVDPSAPDDGSGQSLVVVDRGTVGAFRITPDGVLFVPVVNVTRLVTLAAGTIAVVATAAAIGVRRRGPVVESVHMGPGGWLSIKEPRRRADRRPWWARLIGARRLP